MIFFLARRFSRKQLKNTKNSAESREEVFMCVDQLGPGDIFVWDSHHLNKEKFNLIWRVLKNEPHTYLSTEQ